MQVLRKTRNWRIQRMGQYIVLHMHGRWAKLFSPVSWEYTHCSDIDLLEHEALCIVSGRYDRLATTKVRAQCAIVPEQVAV